MHEGFGVNPERMNPMTRAAPAYGAMSLFRQLLVSAAVAAFSWGCASGGGPVAPGEDAAAQKSSQAQTAASGEYIIGPGDLLRIVVLRNPELNVDVPVRPDGKISTPLISDLLVVGRSPSELAHDIEKTLAEFIREPNVSVIVLTATSRFSQVKVVGQAVSPKAVPFRNGMTVLDLVIEVGGLSQFAAGNRAKIVRSEGRTTREIKVKLDDLLNKGRLSENVALQAGDILVIPESFF